MMKSKPIKTQFDTTAGCLLTLTLNCKFLSVWFWTDISENHSILLKTKFIITAEAQFIQTRSSIILTFGSQHCLSVLNSVSPKYQEQQSSDKDKPQAQRLLLFLPE